MKLGILVAAILVACLAWFCSGPAHAASHVVDSSTDDQWAHDANPGDFVCANVWGNCTLRAAIEEANAQGGPHIITFSQKMIIYIDVSVGPLPPLNEQITLDASGVWDFGDNAPGVLVHGGSGSFTGLTLRAIGCEIYGLDITAFKGSGVYVTSSNNVIGGAGAGQRNVLSGNNTGITLSGSSATHNVLHNNYVGLTALGTTTNPNETGILLTAGASDNFIGGNSAGQSNFVAGNTTNGVMIERTGTDGNLLISNGIGLGVDLTTMLPNGGCGVRIQNGPSNTTIGGASNSGNLVVYNGSSGVHVSKGGAGTEVSWNSIGGNTQDGIYIYDTSGCQAHNNTIKANGLVGVRVVGAPSAGNLIWPNSITDNGNKGILLQNGGNMNIAPPIVASASQWGASGTTCASCRVALYSDDDDEGHVYHDLLWADGSGNWSYVGGPLSGPNLTATAIDISGNTSEFSSPIAVGGGGKYKVYLPSISK